MKCGKKIAEFRLWTIFCVLFLVFGLRGNSQNPKTNYLKLRNPTDLQQLLSYKSNGFFLISAHRGGPENNYPENSIATFENTIRYTPAILEIDPRYTRDSFIVIHHDPTLDRTTTGHGKVSNFTLNELKD